MINRVRICRNGAFCLFAGVDAWDKSLSVLASDCHVSASEWHTFRQITSTLTSLLFIAILINRMMFALL